MIHHERRRVLSFAVTDHPHAEWVVQQLRETFPYDRAPRYVILDRDLNTETSYLIRFAPGALSRSRRLPGHLGKAASRNAGCCRYAASCSTTSWCSERWGLSVRRELLDHVVVMGANHLHRLLMDYVAYSLEDRCHLALDKDAPVPREVTPRPSPTAEVVALPRVGGLHHRYKWSEVRRAA